MDIQRLVELTPYNAVHRKRLLAAVLGRIQAGEYWLAAFANSGLVKPDKLALALSAYYSVHRWRHAEGGFSEHLRDVIPASFARKHSLVPVHVSIGGLSIAVVDPTRVAPLDVIARNTGLDVRPCVTTPGELENQQIRLYGKLNVVTGLNRRWLLADDAVVAAGTRIRRIGVDLLHGQALQARAAEARREETVEQPVVALQLVEPANPDIELFYDLEEIDLSGPEDEKKP